MECSLPIRRKTRKKYASGVLNPEKMRHGTSTKKSDICTDNIVIYHVESGDRIILASDGYPALFETLEETEKYLFQLLDKDPLCIHELRGTKRLINGNKSFDDRNYISFYVS